MDWNGKTTVDSRTWPGVRFVIAKMTFGRRLELMRRVRDLARRLEYFEAGPDERGRMEGSILAGEIDALYVRWGLEEVHGLEIAGAPADVDALIERGPEDLFMEILHAVRAECGLTEAETKN